MASIERTAYPRFKRFMSARELHVFSTPQPDEIVWAREAASSDEHLLALVTQLKVERGAGGGGRAHPPGPAAAGGHHANLRLHAHGRAAPQLGPGPRRGRIQPGGWPGRSPLTRSRRLPDGRMTRPI